MFTPAAYRNGTKQAFLDRWKVGIDRMLMQALGLRLGTRRVAG